MSSDFAIAVDGVGKRYRLGQAASFRYRTLREEIAESFRRGRGAERAEEFWALRDVSFAVGAGETVGIIGRNGAGKSTLLKILARITAPTAGQAVTRGRVGSLLEVGTGFHLELTGHENILLAGAIMGMRRAEVLSRYDEIVEFSGVSRFLDMPVKRYSSGMYMRLAFSVAAHLDPDILLVDEVLAVGDADFQKKCLGRMSDMTSAGRTVLFVSHSMASVFRLCPRVILIDRGGVVADGPSATVVSHYLSSGLGSTAERVWEPDEAPGDGVARLRGVRVVNDEGAVVAEVDVRQRVGVEIEYELLDADPRRRPFANFHFFNDQGVCLFVAADHVNQEWYESRRQTGLVRATCWLPPNLLAEGRVTVLAAVSSYDPTVVHAREDDAVAFMAVDRSAGDGARGIATHDLPGAVRPLLEWTVEAAGSASRAGGAARR